MDNSLNLCDSSDTLDTFPKLSSFQINLLEKLLAFANHQIKYDSEVNHMPSKIIYKLNQEFKLSLVALMTTCALLDPTRQGQESESFFNRQINIIQKNHTKLVHFGQIRPFLIQNFLIPELVDDWITYRDVCGDGIYALKDKKTILQGLDSFSPGGSPVMEFARFYRKFMEKKLQKNNKIQQEIKQTALKSLTDEIVRQKLANGYSVNDVLTSIISDNFLTQEAPENPLLIHKK